MPAEISATAGEKRMKEYDVIVIGGGDVGLAVTFNAVSSGLKVALIEKRKLGGTCVNFGCVPSKMLIYPATLAVQINEAKKFGIHAKISGIDFRSVMERTRRAVKSGRSSIEEAVKDSKNLDFYHEQFRFSGRYTLRAGAAQIKGRKIFIATGSRPAVPHLDGLRDIDYLTNENLLDMKKRPKDMIILGGGYVGCEYAHFFSAMGTKVTVIERGDRLIPQSEPEISELLKKRLRERMKIHTSAEALSVKKISNRCALTFRVGLKGHRNRITAEKLLVAVGRRSNADLLSVEDGGIKTNKKGYIRVNDFLETNLENIWALGDAIGRQMFTHAGDKEAEIAWHNANSRKKMKMDFDAVPGVVFTYPEVASVGLTEEQARKRFRILVGRAAYLDIVQGDAMMEKEGFAKAIVEKNTKRILGFHIIGPYASHIIQEVVNVVANGSTVEYITGSMHTFPTLSDLIPEALNNLN
jgi:mycothione reductase